MAIDRVAWQPDWAVAPGEILLETLDERSMSQSELARRMGRPTKTINEIINGKAAVTPDTAIQLELTLGISATFWNNLESMYRERLARARSKEELAASASWAEQFPLKDLVRHKLIERGRTKGETVAALLSFFGVGSPAAWEGQWLAPSAAFRSSLAFEASPPAVAAWLRWGEVLAARVETRPFNAQRLRDVLAEIRPLTRQADFGMLIERVRTLLTSAGVVLILTPEFAGTRLSGAARWLSGDRALIQLSLRHKTNDHVWFSLFHEAGHLLSHKRVDFVDRADDDETRNEPEGEADRFARDALIPPGPYEAFVSRGAFSAQAVRDFAQQQSIAPGIVVGRLQRDEHIDKDHLNEMKKPVKVVIAW
jgi:HTH-type transcriptional regulator/antitoxin HigA